MTNPPDDSLTFYREEVGRLEHRLYGALKQNRKLTDRLNRYRNVMPGRKRLITLGRIAAMMEYEADQIMQTSPGDGSGDQPTYQDYQALIEDALFLRRLEWDFEQLVDVVWEPKQARHKWPRP